MRKTFKILLVSMFCLLLGLNSPQPILAQGVEPLSKEDQKRLSTPFYDADSTLTECSPNQTAPAEGGDLDRFLKTLAFQESKGNVTATNSVSSASGKYQYLDRTWRGVTRVYPPAQQYARAKDAPEEVQDTIAYFEYAQKAKSLGIDPFKLAVSHFLPAALLNESLLDKVPKGNSLTPRQYAELFVKRYEADEGAQIPLKYTQAPEFAFYASKLGLPPTTATTSPTPLSAGGQATIALDPGHGAEIGIYTDPITGLQDRETPNSPEREDMQEVANLVNGQLVQAGFRVMLVKKQADASVTKRQRVDMAQQASANLAVSLHSDGQRAYDQWAEVWPQFVGGYRQLRDNPAVKVTFENKAVADLSNKYADIFTEERDKAERGGSGVTKKVIDQISSFGPGRGDIPSVGNISLVQLWANSIPWIYNEVGAKGGMSLDQKQKYATGIVNSVKRIFPNAQSTATAGEPECIGAEGSGDAAKTALQYAWPEYRAPGTKDAIELKPEYASATAEAKKRGEYIGGNRYPGVDCGGFVTRVMINSGFEPAYNSSGKGGFTGIQHAWVKANWTRIGLGNTVSTASLRPGDVAFRVNPDGSNDGHTFMYVGDQPGFGDDVASSSLDERAPMAGKENPLAANIEWWRKK